MERSVESAAAGGIEEFFGLANILHGRFRVGDARWCKPPRRAVKDCKSDPVSRVKRQNPLFANRHFQNTLVMVGPNGSPLRSKNVMSIDWGDISRRAKLSTEYTDDALASR